MSARNTSTSERTKAMNFSSFNIDSRFTGVREVRPGVFAVIVRDIVRWEGPSTKAAAEARLNDYVS
jgi:hypothetical protein